jgi:hypothetical protein
MENGGYRASDTNCSLQDWITLNFTQIPQEVVVKLCGDDLYDHISPLHTEEPVEPDSDDFDSGEEYDAAFSAWEQEHEEWESLSAYDLPMWGTMWLAESTKDFTASLEATGFKVFEVVGGPLEDFSSKSLVLFGVNGAGYSFHGSHWIPLRASLCKVHLQKGWITTEDYRKMISLLADLISREGENREHFLKDFAVSDDTLHTSA